MRTVRLTRIATNADEGTFGVLTIDGMPFCVTLEPYDNDNQNSISCIPAQQYICKMFNSSSYGKTYQVMNVPRRTAVLLHPGNRDGDTKGCIILAQYYGKLHGDWATLNSGSTWRKFMTELNGADFLLTITENY